MFSTKLIKIAEQVILACERNNLRLVTAESCTGGLLSSSITSIKGCSKVFNLGLVTYSNKAKINYNVA